MKRITDAAFKYTPSVQTDIRRTFARIKRECARAVEDSITDLLKRQDEKRSPPKVRRIA